MCIRDRYWPVDIDGDSLQDLVVFYWACGEQGRYDDDRQYRRYPFDRPVAIRLIQRKMLDDRPFGITSDEALGWDDVKKSPEKFAKLLAAALARAEDAVWRERLKKAIATLHD